MRQTDDTEWQRDCTFVAISTHYSLLSRHMAAKADRELTEEMATDTTPAAVQAKAAQKFVLDVLQRSRRSFSLGEVVRLAATASHHLSPDVTRAAAATLVEA